MNMAWGSVDPPEPRRKPTEEDEPSFSWLRIVGEPCAGCGGDPAHKAMTCEEVQAVGARVAYGRLPWWKRLRTPKPEGW